MSAANCSHVREAALLPASRCQQPSLTKQKTDKISTLILNQLKCIRQGSSKKGLHSLFFFLQYLSPYKRLFFEVLLKQQEQLRSEDMSNKISQCIAPSIQVRLFGKRLGVKKKSLFSSHSPFIHIQLMVTKSYHKFNQLCCSYEENLTSKLHAGNLSYSTMVSVQNIFLPVNTADHTMSCSCRISRGKEYLLDVSKASILTALANLQTSPPF